MSARFVALPTRIPHELREAVRAFTSANSPSTPARAYPLGRGSPGTSRRRPALSATPPTCSIRSRGRASTWASFSTRGARLCGGRRRPPLGLSRRRTVLELYHRCGASTRWRGRVPDGPPACSPTAPTACAVRDFGLGIVDRLPRAQAHVHPEAACLTPRRDRKLLTPRRGVL